MNYSFSSLSFCMEIKMNSHIYIYIYINCVDSMESFDSFSISPSIATSAMAPGKSSRWLPKSAQSSSILVFGIRLKRECVSVDVGVHKFFLTSAPVSSMPYSIFYEMDAKSQNSWTKLYTTSLCWYHQAFSPGIALKSKLCNHTIVPTRLELEKFCFILSETC